MSDQPTPEPAGNPPGPPLSADKPAGVPSSAANSSARTVAPSLFELFRAFALVSVSGLGGALPWARRAIVEQHRWMTQEEFNETFSLSQFLPGPNLINFSVVFGSRFGGAPGAAVALIGLIGPPMAIVTVLAALYAHFGDLAVLGHILGGIASAAAGLLIANVARMLEPLFRKWLGFGLPVAIAGFVGVALMNWPLPYVFLVLAPVSVAIAWFRPAVRR
jgi:chromate transporter